MIFRRLRLLGTVGEPINPEAWMWYHRDHRQRTLPDCRHLVADRNRRDHDHVRCPAPRRPNPVPATKPFPGIEADVMTRDGKSVGANEGGYLVIKRPWPSMLRTI